MWNTGRGYKKHDIIIIIPIIIEKSSYHFAHKYLLHLFRCAQCIPCVRIRHNQQNTIVQYIYTLSSSLISSFFLIRSSISPPSSPSSPSFPNILFHSHFLFLFVRTPLPLPTHPHTHTRAHHPPLGRTPEKCNRAIGAAFFSKLHFNFFL